MYTFGKIEDPGISITPKSSPVKGLHPVYDSKGNTTGKSIESPDLVGLVRNAGDMYQIIGYTPKANPFPKDVYSKSASEAMLQMVSGNDKSGNLIVTEAGLNFLRSKQTTTQTTPPSEGRKLNFFQIAPFPLAVLGFYIFRKNMKIAIPAAIGGLLLPSAIFLWWMMKNGGARQ